MIIAYLCNGASRWHKITNKNSHLLKKAIWIDLVYPSEKEEALVEEAIKLNVPTRREMQEIELSSRLYKTNHTLFMTAIMIAQSDSNKPYLEPVSFVLTAKQLITVRYVEPQAFKLFASQLDKFNLNHEQAFTMFIGLIEAIIDRLADILELVGARLDTLSQQIFRRGQVGPESHKVNYEHIMQAIGLNADLVTQARESLMTFNRVVGFFLQSSESKLQAEAGLRTHTASSDIQALSDYAAFISNKVTFLLDATLGMIDIEQSSIIKIFSVAAVIFLPPTLIASIYGMNFKFMPELSYKWGYLIAIALMILSAFIPYKYFKYKKWL